MLLLHADHAARNGSDHVFILSEDTDVFVLCLGLHRSIKCGISIVFGKAGKRECVSINSLGVAMGDRLLKCIIGFHSLTGCDTTSAFHSKGKTKPFDILWQSQKDANLIAALMDLGSSWDKLKSETIRSLEKFVCKIYGSKETNLNIARYKIFISKALNEKRMPPTLDSFELHCGRSNYQVRIHKLTLTAITDCPELILLSMAG